MLGFGVVVELVVVVVVGLGVVAPDELVLGWVAGADEPPPELGWVEDGGLVAFDVPGLPPVVLPPLEPDEPSS